MAFGQPQSYRDWFAQNEQLVQPVVQRYAQPAPAAPPEPTPVEPGPVATPVEHVEMLPQSGNPYQQLYDAQSDRVGNVNAQIDSTLREGAAKEQGAKGVAAKEQEYADGAKKVQAAAEDVNTRHRAQKDQLLAEREQLMRDLDQPIKGLSSGKKVASMIAGIIGAASMGGGGTGSNPNPGMGAMMSMMQGYIQSSAEKELQERAQKSQRIQARDELIDLLSKDGSNELDLSNKILANRWFVAAKEADAIAKNAEGTAYGEQAKQAAIAWRDKGSQIVEGLAQQRVAADQAKKAAAAKGANEKYWTVPLSDLMALNASGGLPSAGQKILAQRIKNDQDLRGGEAKIGGDLAAAQKAALDAAGGGVAAPAGEEIENGQLYTQTSDAEKAEFRAKQRDTKDLKDSIAFIRKILQKSGTEAWGSEAAKLRTYAGTLMGQYNRGAKFGAMDNGTMGLLTDVLGDPTALTTGGPTALAKLDAVEKSADSSLDNHRVTVGLASRDPALLRSRNVQRGGRDGTQPSAPSQEDQAVAGPPAPPAPAPQQDAVIMVLPMTGQQVPVPANRPDLVEAMRAKRGAVTIEEYQDAERQLQFESEQGQNALAYQEGR